MLKDITLGQYFPGDSILHRLDPRTKLIGLVCYIVALFLAKSYVSYALMALVLIALSALAHIRAKTLLSGLKPLIFIVVFTGVINLFYGSGDRHRLEIRIAREHPDIYDLQFRIKADAAYAAFVIFIVGVLFSDLDGK